MSLPLPHAGTTDNEGSKQSITVRVANFLGVSKRHKGPHEILLDHDSLCRDVQTALGAMCEIPPERIKIIVAGRTVDSMEKVRDIAAGAILVEVRAVLRREANETQRLNRANAESEGHVSWTNLSSNANDKDPPERAETGEEVEYLGERNSGEVAMQRECPVVSEGSLNESNDSAPDSLPSLFSISSNSNSDSDTDSNDIVHEVNSESENVGRRDSVSVSPNTSLGLLHERVQSINRNIIPGDAPDQEIGNPVSGLWEDILFEASIAASSVSRNLALESRSYSSRNEDERSRLIEELRSFADVFTEMANRMETNISETRRGRGHAQGSSTRRDPSPARIRTDTAPSLNSIGNVVIGGVPVDISGVPGGIIRQVMGVLGSIGGGSSGNSSSANSSANSRSTRGNVASAQRPRMSQPERWSSTNSNRSAIPTTVACPTSVDLSRSAFEEAKLLVRLAISQRSNLSLSRLLAGVLNFPDPSQRIETDATPCERFVVQPFMDCVFEFMRVTSVSDLLIRENFFYPHLDKCPFQERAQKLLKSRGGGGFDETDPLISSGQAESSEVRWRKIVNDHVDIFAMGIPEWLQNVDRSILHEINQKVANIFAELFSALESSPKQLFAKYFSELICKCRVNFLSLCARLEGPTEQHPVRVCRLLLSHILASLPFGCAEVADTLAGSITRVFNTPTSIAIQSASTTVPGID